MDDKNSMSASMKCKKVLPKDELTYIATVFEF